MPDIHPQADLRELAYPYALDALTDADRRTVEQLLEHADEPVATEFRSTVHDLRETLASMTLVDAVPAPAELEYTIDTALDAQLAAPSLAAARRRRLRLYAVAAAAAVAIGIGAGITIYRNQSPASGELTAQQVITHGDARQQTLPVATGGTITVDASRQLGAAILYFDAVPAPPPEHTYQLWLISPAGQPRSAGVVPTLPTSTAPILMRVGDATQIALSIEPDGGSPAPTTTPVVGVTLS
ncbi:anti-sigma factor domain-containing protein [Nocardia sp. NPDC059240]|uniref:anti-sigma factor n=1 Tax=Nocardia sp. NPDC059240 TaxID=3346786 RepID=UPI0036C25A99